MRFPCGFCLFFMSNSHSAVACILGLSGCVAFNPFLVCIYNLHGLSIQKKCVVVLLSIIASVPSAVISGVCIVDWIILFLFTIWLQYPPTLQIFLVFLFEHPPNGLSRVASALWYFLFLFMCHYYVCDQCSIHVNRSNFLYPVHAFCSPTFSIAQFL